MATSSEVEDGRALFDVVKANDLIDGRWIEIEAEEQNRWAEAAKDLKAMISAGVGPLAGRR